MIKCGLVEIPDLARTLEIGICGGQSATHLAAGNSDGVVISIDIKLEAKSLIDALLIPDLVSVTCDSMAGPHLFRWMPEIDVHYIDGDHTLSQAYGEYELYLYFVRDGALVFFDELHISPEMEFMWRSVADPKGDLVVLHYVALDVALKDPAARPVTLDAVSACLRRWDTRNEARSLR